MGMENSERLDALRTVIVGECDRRLTRDHGLGLDEVARWLLDHQPGAVTGDLTDLVGQVMQQLNDDARVEQILEAKPQLEAYVEMLRDLSVELGVPLWSLLSLRPADVGAA